jgi:hypothetical protein
MSTTDRAGDGATTGVGADSRETPPTRCRTGIGPVAGGIWALSGGLIAWALICVFDPVFTVPQELEGASQRSAREQIVATVAAGRRVNTWNMALILTSVGALVGGAMAFGEGLSRRSIVRASIGPCFAAVVGAGYAVLGGWLGGLAMAGCTARLGAAGAEAELPRTILVQAVIMATMGAGIGLAFGIVRGRSGDLVMAMCGGVLAGVLAASLYPFSAACLLPRASTELLVPLGALNRLLWIGLIAVLVGAAVPGMKWRRTPLADREARTAS